MDLGLDMVEVASSNLAGPTKHKKGLLIAGFFVFGGLPHSEGGEASRQTRP
jgi:hypothetical protein